jgi:hypothetical protein
MRPQEADVQKLLVPVLAALLASRSSVSLAKSRKSVQGCRDKRLRPSNISRWGSDEKRAQKHGRACPCATTGISNLSVRRGFLRSI